MKRVLLLLLIFPTSAFACLNDRETIKTENEFRSRYVSAANPGSAGPQRDSSGLASTYQWNLGGIVMTVAGVALFAGGMRIARRRLGAGAA